MSVVGPPRLGEAALQIETHHRKIETGRNYGFIFNSHSLLIMATGYVGMHTSSLQRITGTYIPLGNRG